MNTSTALHGKALLDDPIKNNDTAFSLEERSQLGLEGLLPHTVETLDRQFDRVMMQLSQQPTPLAQFLYLTGIQDRNETLFLKVFMSDQKRFLPIIYDPTVGEACLQYGHIYRRPRGLYISLDMRGRIAEVLRNWPGRDVRFILVSSGGRILGLGDIGVNGMPIPVGKLQLYTACAAVPPGCVLPILMDIGTTNAPDRADPLYLGSRQEPPSTADLDSFVEEFFQALQEVFPGCCIHLEDWKGTDAMRLLDQYKEKVLCYDDDIQGTGAVTLAALITASKNANEKLTDQRILFLGAGSAGLGIGGLIAKEMQNQGLSQEEALGRISLFDVNGLIEPSRKDLNQWQKPFAHKAEPSDDLVQTIKTLKPSILIGVSTAGGTFTQEVVETMGQLNKRPIIFAFSNPTANSECTAEQAYAWLGDQVVFAGGIQFPDVHLNGKTYHPEQVNNIFVFPAIGLATYCVKPRLITDECFIAAAHAIADQVTDDDRAKGLLFPPQTGVLQAEITTAIRVAEFMFDNDLATVKRPADIRAFVEAQLYKPAY